MVMAGTVVSTARTAAEEPELGCWMVWCLLDFTVSC
jgi:hypothetical protein